ncbi:MAG: hypothetical protein PHF74_02240 [Dehalococcoidales bacterium]|nr:hypothetical protein [Dehalococcoidales bacterium]
MEIKENPPKRTAFIWLGIAIAGIIIIFLPGIIGLDGFDGGFALSAGGLMVAITGFVAAAIYFRLARNVDSIMRNVDVLAYWTYTPEQWRQYTEEEHKEDAAAKRGLFMLIAIIAVIVGIIMAIAIRENFHIIALIILGIIAVAGLSAFFSTIASYRYNKKHHGEVYITPDGAYFNRQMHIWKGIGNQLEEISLDDDGTGLNRLIITYSALAAYKRNSYTIRIPVPPGEEETAKKIVKQIGHTNLEADSNDI